MPTESIGVQSTDCAIQDLCVVNFTDQTSFTMTSKELADCIMESPQMQRSPTAKLQARRCYMKEWPGKLF